jgi:hypothetical protein
MVWLGPLSSALCPHLQYNYLPALHRSKKSKIQSQDLTAAILEGLMPITTEPEPEDSDEDAPCRVCLDIFLWRALFSLIF